MDDPLARTAAVVLVGDQLDGTPLALAPVHGRPLIAHVADEVGRWPVGRRIVVLGAEADAVIDAAELPPGITVIIDPDWSDGATSQLQVALDHLTRAADIDRVIVWRATQPEIPAGVVDRLLDVATQSGASPAVVPKYRYARGEPVAIAAPLWPRLMGLEGHVALDSTLEAHPDWVTEVWVDRLPPRRLTSAEDLTPAVSPRPKRPSDGGVGH